MQQSGQPSLQRQREGDVGSGEPGIHAEGQERRERHIGRRIQFADTIM